MRSWLPSARKVGQVITGPPHVSRAELERERIAEALARCGGNQSEAAKALGIGRTTPWRKMKGYGIEERSGA